MIQGILLEEGIPSMMRRSARLRRPRHARRRPRATSSCPPRALPAARDVLLQADLLAGRRPGPPSSARRGCSASCWPWWSFVGRRSPGSAPRSSPRRDAPAQARRLRPRRLRHRARLVADLLGRRRARADRGVHARGVRGRDHLLRHRQRLRPRRRRARVGRDPRRLSARLLRASRPSSTSRCRPRTAGSRASRSTSRSTARWSAWGWTTSTSTSAIATTSRRRWRRRCRR